MPENTRSVADTADFQSGSASVSDGYYANNPSQRAPLLKRLKSRRMTLRKVALYAVVAAIVVLSTPMMATFIAGSMVVAAGLALRIWTFGHLEKTSA